MLGFLLDRDISTFNPKASPPMTSAKQELIEGSRPLLRQHLNAIVDALPDLVTVNSIIERLPAPLRLTSPRAIGKELREMGARKVHRGNKVRLLNGGRRHVWALRRAALYDAMSEGKIGELFSAMHTPTARPGASADLDLG